jgi:putative ribosome biogenesis GTPase RsgA
MKNTIVQNKNAIVLIGDTGVGKTTLINGFSGFKIVYNHQTRDFRPLNK